jgi:hypothetical protein
MIKMSDVPGIHDTVAFHFLLYSTFWNEIHRAVDIYCAHVMCELMEIGSECVCVKCAA